ncbi:transglycosylase SLT domain-containing protein [Bradyrhizobium sp. WD16]|uniref:transglycosylase SLT domain-containing protein n=1 Tax=Bradyrhizobium sp. WD16 TaxID=1521768 RepID=UPI0020A4B436|nr:transglycosylase SLT domain-containing protein [Bradyrhizobium sp. WD16]
MTQPARASATPRTLPPGAPSRAPAAKLARLVPSLLPSVALATLLAIGAHPTAATAVPLPKPRPPSQATQPRSSQAQTSPSAVKPAAKAMLATAVAPSAAVTTPAQSAQHAVPRKRQAPLAMSSSSSTPQADAAALEQVIEQIRENKNPAGASQVAAGIGDPVARKLAEWIILRSDNNGASMERYRAFIAANPSWPSMTLLRRRAEAALWDDRRDDATVLGYFGDDEPTSGKGRLVLARALLNRGDRRNAEHLVREAWRSDPMTSDTEAAALNQFGAMISAGDHKARMDYFLYANDAEISLRAANRLGAGYVAFAKARLAANRKASNANALLAAVPHELHSDPGFIFSRIQELRREEKFGEAAQLMLAAPRDPARLINLDEWWVERRLLARKLLDDGDYRTAYAIARDAATPTRDIYKTEHQFTAGWIALRFLNDPATAAAHFARIGVGSSNPTALARAGYWQGRAAEAMGRGQEARAAYQSAAAHSTSYYGQLARARLGLPQLGLREAPGRGRGSDRLEVVRAVELLYALDEGEIAVPVLAEMGEKADDPEALAALCELAQRNHDARGMLLVGKAALNRGMPFDHYAYPVSGIPAYKTIGPEVERSVVFAIARQESAFNPRVVSSANAMGLLQVTPAAGRYVTKKYGEAFDQKRLLSDPAYNASVGAGELGGLIEDYRGSYILTFAGYNAGRGSVRKWLDRYGDPRDPKVDAVDWVERIPFSETRNYVQRVMENLQVYRARFGGGARLQIEADLRRGSVVE